MSKHQHDHAKAKGGFWIRQDGSSAPVLDEAEHHKTVERELGKGHSYNAAYRHGWVRISFCGGPAYFGVSFTEAASIEALKECRDLIRHYQGERTRFSVEVEWPGAPVNWDAWEASIPRGERFVSAVDADRAAKHIMHWATKLNACRKAAERLQKAA